MTGVLLIGHSARAHVLAETFKRNKNVKLFSFMKSKNPGVVELSEKFEVGSYSDNEYYYVSILTSIVPFSTLSDAKSLTEEEVSIISMDKLDDVPFANMAREMLEHCRKVYI